MDISIVPAIRAHVTKTKKETIVMEIDNDSLEVLLEDWARKSYPEMKEYSIQADYISGASSLWIRFTKEETT